MRGSIGVASIMDKIRKTILRWFGHVMRWEETKAVRVVIKMNVEGKKGRGRPREIRDGGILLRMI